MISIIIPLYNKEDYIRATLDSILSQTFQDFEVVVVNDGSTDNSLSVVGAYSDSRLKVFDKANGGVSRARNFGFQQSKGEWVMFLDADDTIMPNCLETLHQLICDFPSVSLVSANYNTVYGESKVVKGCSLKVRGILNDPFKNLWDMHWKLRLGAYAFKRDLFDKVGGFSTQMKKGEDAFFDNSLIQLAKIAYSPQIIMSYNREGSFFSNISISLSEFDIFYQNLDDGSKYEKLVKAAIVWKGICQLIVQFNPTDILAMLKKYKGHYCLLLESFVLRCCKMVVRHLEN